MIYYNELDNKKAAWLRELIKAGVIADGEVDERSICDVEPSDLVGYRQCHFFAGIGIWSYALRLAGWPDDREVWTFSCPCQPFSTAGKKKGIADRRHLFPEQFRLIKGRRPVVCFGEQVSSPDGLAWLDIVRSDMEGEAYAFGAIDLCAAGAGAPHIRNRTFFMADDLGDRVRAIGRVGVNESTEEVHGEFREREWLWVDTGEYGTNGGVGNSDSTGSQRRGIRNSASECVAGSSSMAGRMEDSDCGMRREGWSAEPGKANSWWPYSGSSGPGDAECAPGPVNGFWSNAGWVLCRPERDGGNPSWRPVESGTFPLASGIAGRVGKLRGFGDGIVAPVAAQFIKVCIEERRYGCSDAAGRNKISVTNSMTSSTEGLNS